MRKSIKIKTFTIAILSLLAFAFLLGFSLSVQAYRISQQELNSPVSRYLRENYGVNSVEEYQAKLEQEAWLNISKQMGSLATEYPEINFSQWRIPDVYRQYGTSTYQPPKMTPQQPFYVAVFSEPVTALQVFSLSGLGLIGLAAVPPIRKNKRLKQALVWGVVVLAAFSVGYFVGLTAAQTGTITIEPGSFTETASYVIWTDGTNVYARNGKTGAIEFSGSDASTVIQSALNALGTSGGQIFIKAGTYYISSTLKPKSNTEIVGVEGASVLKRTADVPLISLEEYKGISVSQARTVIRSLTLDGGGFASDLISVVNSKLCSFEHISFINFKGNGIRIWSDVSYSFWNRISNCIFEGLVSPNSGACIKLEQTYDNFIDHNVADGVDSGAIFIWMSHGRGAHVVIDNHANRVKNFALLQAADGQKLNDNIFIGNIIDSTTEHGIVLQLVNQHAYNNMFLANRFVRVGKPSPNTYDCFYFKSTSSFVIQKNIVAFNFHWGASSDIYHRYVLTEDKSGGGWINTNYYIFNKFEPGLTGYFNLGGEKNFIKGNLNYITENSGTATILAGTTSVTVAHGLATTPSKVLVTPRANIGSVWVSARNSTHITISCSTAPTADTTVDWYAEV